MGSTFGGYNIAYSGMYVNQAGLGTTGTNLANVNTAGASRVRVASSEKNTVLSTGAAVGSGVNIASITRARDQLLDSTYRNQNSQASYYSVKNGNLEYIDKTLTEYEADSSDESDVDDTGLQQMMEDFFNSWQTLSTDASTESTRTAVTEAGITLISALTDIDSQLQQLQTDAITAVKDGIDSVNDLAAQVAELNHQISQAELDGSEASYLRDQRDSLLDELSSLAEIRVVESNGTLQVTLGGTSLVQGDTSKTLTVKGSGTEADPLRIEDSSSGYQITIGSGSIGAYLADADQSNYETISQADIPYDLTTSSFGSSITAMRQSLNDLVTTLAIKVNALHQAGTDLNGDSGEAFFTATDATQPLSITNIEVNPSLVEDPDKLVAAGSAADGDNTVANAICDLYSDTTCFQCGGLALDITGFYQAVTSWVATTGATSASNYTNQVALSEQVNNQRQAVASISIDEEMSNMMMYQNAYTASSKVLSTLDELIASLINDLG